MTDKLYYRYWGKAKSDKDIGASYHLLPYHCLDVAAVADRWWQYSNDIKYSFIEATGLTEKQNHAWLLFFSLCMITENSICVFSVKRRKLGKPLILN